MKKKCSFCDNKLREDPATCVVMTENETIAEYECCDECAGLLNVMSEKMDELSNQLISAIEKQDESI